MGKACLQRGQTEAGTDDIRARGEQKEGQRPDRDQDGERKTLQTAERHREAVEGGAGRLRNGVLLMPVAQMLVRGSSQQRLAHWGRWGHQARRVTPQGPTAKLGGTLAWIPEARTSAGRRVLLHGGGDKGQGRWLRPPAAFSS